MSDNANKTSTTNELARERSKAAADRTLMAWIRTSIAMIGFGFGIGKLSEALEKASSKQVADPIYGSRVDIHES